MCPSPMTPLPPGGTGRAAPSNLPSSRETEALLSTEKRDLFTDDAWQGMLK